MKHYSLQRTLVAFMVGVSNLCGCVTGLFLLGCGRPASIPAQQQSQSTEASALANQIKFEDSTLTLNGVALQFPCLVEDLRKALGPPDRTTKLIFTISTWDKLGIIAYEGTVGSPVSAIKIYFQKSDDKYCPNATFDGTFEYGGKKLDRKSTKEDLIAAGLAPDNIISHFYSDERGERSVIADYEHAVLNGISIGK